MKKTILVALLMSALTISAFAQEADEYVDDNTETTEIKKNQPKKSIFSFGNNKKILEGEEDSVAVKGITGQLKQQRATFSINLENEESGFGCPYLASYSYVFMDAENAKYFANAFEQYEKDFEEKRLERKGSKLYKKYGKYTVSVKWGSVKLTTPNNAKGTAFLGYEFVDRSPYFTITIYPLKNKYYETESTAQKESPTFKFYFTKAQAKELIENMSEENIQEMLNQFNGAEAVVTDGDQY